MTLRCPRALLLFSEVLGKIGGAKCWKELVWWLPSATPNLRGFLSLVSDSLNSREWLGRLNAFNRPSNRPWETTLTTTAALFCCKPLHGAFHTRLYRILHVKCHNLIPRATSSIGTPKKFYGNDWNRNIL